VVEEMSVEFLITGAGGALGSVILRQLVREGTSAVGTLSVAGPAPGIGNTHRVDLADATAIGRLIKGMRPGIIIHAAAMTSVQSAYDNPTLAQAVNVGATKCIAESAETSGARLVYISTDMVFDGADAPYAEEAATRPLSVYGRTKADAERVVRSMTGSLVIRLPLLYGLPGVERDTTFLNQMKALRRGESLRLFEDEYRSPIDLEDAASSILLAASSDYSGVLHVAGPQRLSRLEMGCIMADALGVSRDLLVPTKQADMKSAEARPRDVSLASGLFEKLFNRKCGRTMTESMVEIVRKR
jgi:dTDP-4-dehydrorhamnose reductase